MSATEQKLKPCPFCGGEPFHDAYDRLIVIGCKPCEYRRAFRGLLQTAESSVKVSESEYYHKDAGAHAAEAWNRRAPTGATHEQ